ncbi:low temperature requirement protein A [Micromonospora sp. A3M-1-15]|uniref:low temperature requirement protein A n=1 Tax=Micromonospora TaxID=1873 RepID=UPI0020B88669|nr:low temperature requirement protein A [Micromonospora sp. A3M-1-15]MCP3785420.1 low temperature requirement protein A [Micromonospora sp. A3M-1-15]
MATSASGVERLRAAISRRIRFAPGGVTRLELFLDLVFVYAFINVTDLMSANFHPVGLVRGLLVVALLWRCWVSYAWLGNLVRLDRGIMPLIVFGAAACIFVVGVTIPEAFADRPHGLPGPLVFAIAFVLVRLGPLLVASVAVWNSDGRRPFVRRAWTPLFASAPLLLASASLPLLLPTWAPAHLVQLVLFAVATGADFLGLMALGTSDWQLMSVGHWAQRHSLIVLIALGETIISIGTSRGLVGDPPITWSVIVGSALGFVVVAVLWWSYFDIARFAAEQSLQRLPNDAKALLGRDAYALLHLPMVGGLILLALGLKHALSSTEVSTADRWDTGSVLVLYGGAVLYLLGLLAFEKRAINLVGRSVVLGIVLLVAVTPVALNMPTLGSLAILAAGAGAVVVADRTVFHGRHRRLHGDISATVGRVVAVRPNELFLDLMVVYAFIQITVLVTRQPSPAGVIQGLGVLVLLWWSWCFYAWLGSATTRVTTSVRVTTLTAAALTLILGIATPQAFSRVPGGLPGPLIVVTCYVATRVLHIASFWWFTRANPVLRAQVFRAAVPAAAALSLLVGATLTFPEIGEAISPVSAACWAVALVVDLAGGYLIGPRNWRIRLLEHWTERYHLIVLIAFGEGFISTGVALADTPISLAALLAITFIVTLLAALWWTYAGTDRLLHQRLPQLSNARRRAALARDAYTYLHLLPVAGLILVALGLTMTLEQVADRPAAPLEPLGHAALYGGVLLFLAGDQLIWWRARGALCRRRLLGTLVVALAAPATILLPSLAALVLLAALGLTVATTTPLQGKEGTIAG